MFYRQGWFMPKISRVEVFQVDLVPKVLRGDAIQAFSKQETPMVRIWTDDGAEGTGYSYTRHRRIRGRRDSAGPYGALAAWS